MALLWINVVISQSVNDFYFPDAPKYPIENYRILIPIGAVAVVLSFMAGMVAVIKKEKGWLLLVSLAVNLVALYLLNVN